MKFKKIRKLPKIAFLTLFAATLILPVLYTLTNSFMGNIELSLYYGNINQENAKTFFHIFPDWFSFENYYEVLINTPHYLSKYWITIFLSVTITMGQVIISCLAGYGFAKFEFKFKNTLFFFVVIMMLMPYQVTLVSNYIVLDKLNLINTYWALILPSVFSPFGVFLMNQIFSVMPNETIEAARLDGANEFMIFLKVIIPQNKSGVISLMIITFIDCFNMVEQPISFLKDNAKYPISVLISRVGQNNLGASFACGVLVLIPVLLLFLYCENELVDGISMSAVR